MILLPAVDIRGGRCVRLFRGKPGDQTVYAADPVAQARSFADAGVERLHVVDLDGALDGEPRHAELVGRIVAEAGVQVQVGGGIRSREAADRYLRAGAAAVVTGTRAVEDPDWLAELAAAWPGRVIVALDARGERVVTRGWTRELDVAPWDLAARLAELPLAAVLYTEVEVDGTQMGPAVDGVARMVAAGPLPVQASGGVGRLDDLRALAEEGAAACVVGRALYEGAFRVADALALLAGI